MLTVLRPEQILKILEITDSLNIHRESILIPLRAERHGNIEMLSDGKIRITCPASDSFDGWLEQVRTQLRNMDLTRSLTKH